MTLAIRAINEINTLLGKGAEARYFGLDQKRLDAIDRQAREEALQIGRLRGASGAEIAALQAERARDLLRQYGYESGQLQVEIKPVVSNADKLKPPELLDSSGNGSGRNKDLKDRAGLADKLSRQLDADQRARNNALFNSEMELERLKYEQKREYQEKLNQLAELSLPAAARSQFNILARLNSNLAALEVKGKELENDVMRAERNLEQAKASAAAARAMGTPVMSGGGRYIEGSIGPTSTGPHFDIKRLDGAFFARNFLDQFVRVNGGPLSAGRTVQGGEFGASRSYGEHRGWDYAFGGGAALELMNGAMFQSNRSTIHGDATVFTTPDGSQFQILHGKFQPGTGPSTAVAGADMSTAMAGGGGVGAAEAQLEGANSKLELFNQNLEKMKAAEVEIAMLKFTDAFKGQTEAIQNQTETLQLRNRLQVEGVRSEIIDGEVKKLEVNRQVENATLTLNKALEEKIITQDQYNKLLAQTNQLAGENAAAIEAQTTATIQANDALKVKQQAEQLASQISGAITGALGDVIKGTKSVEEAFSEMLTNIGNMFIDMAMKILQDAITKQLVGLFSGLLAEALAEALLSQA